MTVKAPATTHELSVRKLEWLAGGAKGPKDAAENLGAYGSSSVISSTVILLVSIGDEGLNAHS